jgi:DNA-binding protein YbaB
MSAEMDALVERATAKLEHLEQALDGLNRVRGEFTTEDGAITAEVDGNGALSGLWLAESVTEMQARELGRLITSACQQAAAVAGEQRSKILATLNDGFAETEAAGAATGQAE